MWWVETQRITKQNLQPPYTLNPEPALDLPGDNYAQWSHLKASIAMAQNSISDFRWFSGLELRRFRLCMHACMHACMYRYRMVCIGMYIYLKIKP